MIKYKYSNINYLQRLKSSDINTPIKSQKKNKQRIIKSNVFQASIIYKSLIR